MEGWCELGTSVPVVMAGGYSGRDGPWCELGTSVVVVVVVMVVAA